MPLDEGEFGVMLLGLFPVLFLGTAIGIDEFYFHHKRGLPMWERIGHPLDTLSLLACLVFSLVMPYSWSALKTYIALSFVSILFITKDEFVHFNHCSAAEQWLHAALFVFHPVVLVVIALAWSGILPGMRTVLMGQAVGITGFMLYQVIYWNWIRERAELKSKTINNEVYDSLGERWYHADDDPIALLRAEAEVKNPWVAGRIQSHLGTGTHTVLDIGTGGGFLSNSLARAGHHVTGVDLSKESLKIAARMDCTSSVKYEHADAYALPYRNQSFDVACAMDFLEHVEEPSRVIAEASRVLKPGGLFFFYTFNRNFFSWLFVIKGVEWFVKNTPENLHLHRLFIRPAEMRTMCLKEGLLVEEFAGIAPVVFSAAFWKMLVTRRVPPQLLFRITGSLKMSYTGVARKAGGPIENKSTQ